MMLRVRDVIMRVGRVRQSRRCMTHTVTMRVICAVVQVLRERESEGSSRGKRKEERE